MAQQFDQEAWEQTTTWEGELPSPGDLWALLQDDDLPEPFREAVRGCLRGSPLLRAGLAQDLARDGLADEEVARRMSEVTGTRHPTRVVAGLLARRLAGSDWKVRFTNLVSGRFTELAFERAFRAPLEEAGLDLAEETALGTFLDYRARDGKGFEIGINLKNAGVQYRDSKKWVGLEPEDTLPIATYKIFGSEAAGVPPLIYVYLVDWDLIERLRAAYWRAMSAGERDAFKLLASTSGLPRRLEDAFIGLTVGQRIDALIAAVGYRGDLTALPFRAISAARCRRLFYDNHDRSPYVYRQKMKTDPNVHISVERETLAFGDFLYRYLRTPAARRRLIDELARTAEVTIPAPRI